MIIKKIIEVLEKSVEKNGEIPLTNKHLLNIMKMIRRKQEYQELNAFYDEMIKG